MPTPARRKNHLNAVVVPARPQIEDIILAELAAKRRQHRAERGYLPGPGVRPFVPRAGRAINDLTPDQLSDLLFYFDAGYLQIIVPDRRGEPGAL